MRRELYSLFLRLDARFCCLWEFGDDKKRVLLTRRVWYARMLRARFVCAFVLVVDRVGVSEPRSPSLPPPPTPPSKTLAGDANFEDPENAQAIVVPGWEISADMEEEKWDAILEHPQIVFARTSPQQKLVIVENNQVFTFSPGGA